MVQTLFHHKWLILTALIIILLSALAFILPSAIKRLITQVVIMALFATSLNIMVGYGGMMPLGQAMFFGFGAYSYGLLVLRGGLPMGLAALVSLLMSLVINMIIGYFCLRGDPMTFGLLHFAFNMLIYMTIIQLVYFTGGNAGMSGVPRPDIFSNPTSFFFFVLVIVLICLILIKKIVDSPFGKTVQGLRENEERLKFLGINTRNFQLTIFVISGLFTTVAGILFAMLENGAFPDFANPLLSAQALMMCLIGGMSNFAGPSLGALITVVAGTELSNYINQWQGILGAIIVTCAIGFQGGILGWRKSKPKIFAPIIAKLSSKETPKNNTFYT